MSSPNNEPDRVVPALPDLAICLSPAFERLVAEAGLCAGLLAYRPAEEAHYRAMCSVALPLAPFNGSAADSLTAQLLDCHLRHPRPHVHSLKSSALWKEMSSVCDTGTWRSRAIFIPFLARDDALDFLLFSVKEDSLKAAPQIISECERLAAHAAALMGRYPLGRSTDRKSVV